jgi:hypothetical protein
VFSLDLVVKKGRDGAVALSRSVLVAQSGAW